MSVANPGYFDSPWPAEDAGPERLQAPWSGAGLGLRAGESLEQVSRRIHMGTMTVLGAPGEVYLLTHTMLRNHALGQPTTAQVERLDPHSLATLERSPRLAGGPAWPGGMAVHRNGSLYVVYGRYAHRLSRACAPTGSYRLPVDRPYNSFVVLDNGLLVTKDLSRREPSRLTALDPETMRPASADVTCPEATVARLSARGNTVYVVGVRSIFRYRWDDSLRALAYDEGWRFDYVGSSKQSYGWDVVLDGENAWFMDNGEHRYQVSMIGAGVSPTPNRLIRVSLTDASDHDAIEISGLPGGSITNPPLYDRGRGIVVGYDSANRYMRAWHYDASRRALEPLWEKPELGCSSHMVLFASTGEVVTNDYRRRGEEIVVLAIETGEEKARARIGGLMQGVVFPSVGFGRDLYWTTFSRVARLFVR